MQRKVVRRARTRVASPAQADGPSFRPVGRRTPARLRPRPTEFQILQTTPLRMGSVWANIARTKVGVRTEQQPNISSAPNAFQTEAGRPKLNSTSPDAIQSHTSSPPLERRSALDVAGFRRVCIARHHSDCPGQFRFPGRHPVSNSAGESRARKRYRERTAKWNQKWNRW